MTFPSRGFRRWALAMLASLAMAPTFGAACTSGDGDTATASTTDPPAAASSDAPDAASVAPPSEPTRESSGDGFVEDFTDNVGLDRFRNGVFHRDDEVVATTEWTGDHDDRCGPPDTTSRLILRDEPASSFYMCRDHLMTSVGDTSGYSIAWFTPDRTFDAGTHTTVSFDVNITDLGARQWWEVSIIPVGSPYLATVGWVAEVAHIDAYDDASVVVGSGPYGNDGNIVTDGESHDPLGEEHVCGEFPADPEACASKAIRRTFTITDNLDGTLTFGFLGDQYTYPGHFPEQFEVYFKDHNYTPDKDGAPIGHTWHWDNIVVG
jgi:hypothetical protein